MQRKSVKSSKKCDNFKSQNSAINIPEFFNPYDKSATILYYSQLAYIQV